MVVLLHNDCDGYPSVWGSFENDPTVEQVKKVLLSYYDEDVALDAAEEIVQHGEHTINNRSNDTFTLENA